MEVIIAVQNRVPEPKSTSFVVVSPAVSITRLRTNVDTDADVRFTGSIAGTVLTADNVNFGVILPGATLFGVGVVADTTIVEQLTGPTGGAGTYTVSPTQTVSTSVLSTGARLLEQGAQYTIQCDFHSADQSAADAAMIASTKFRDQYGTSQFAGQSPNYGVSPLYADDPRYAPFLNESQQTEWRWVLDMVVQANPVVSIPSQYADVIEVQTIDVDAVYPP